VLLTTKCSRKASASYISYINSRALAGKKLGRDETTLDGFCADSNDRWRIEIMLAAQRYWQQLGKQS